MIDTLIAFGCSFTYGDELLDPNIGHGQPCNSKQNETYRNSHCYAGLIAKHYNFKFINTAFPGGSLESMRYALYWTSNNYNLKNVLCVAGLTQAHRNSYFDENLNDPPWNRFRHSTWLKNDTTTAWGKLNQSWLTLSKCNEWQQFNLYQTVKMFESFSPNIVLLPVFRDESSFTSDAKTKFILEDVLSCEDFARYGHPNESGHQKVANRLIEHIDSVKLV